MLRDTKKKKFDAVIAKSVSRLGRNTIENLQTAHEIKSMDIRLILPEDSYDTSTCTSKLTFQLKAVLAGEESAKLSNRIKIGLMANARQGVYKASLPTFGYKRDGIKLILDEAYIHHHPVQDVLKFNLFNVSWCLKLILVDPNN